VASITDAINSITDAVAGGNDAIMSAWEAQVDATCGTDDKDKPCFARNTFAIGVNGENIPMASLRSGDVVKDGAFSTTRIVVNQHRAGDLKSSLVNIEHSNGELSLTPDHVLEVDGVFAAARTALPGTKLGGFEVSRVTPTSGEVINPLTVSGKILTQGGVLASTYPEWIAEYMLSSSFYPLPVSLSNALSYIFPETAQAYYDSIIEDFTRLHHPTDLKAALPDALVPAAFVLGDLAVSAGFVAFSLASPTAAMALLAAAVMLAVKSRAK